MFDILGFRRCSWAVDARLQNLHQRLVYAASDPWVRNRVSLWQLDELHAGLCCWREIDFAFVKVKYVEGSYGFSSSLMGQLHCSFKAEKEGNSLLTTSRVVLKLLSDPCSFFVGGFLRDQSNCNWKSVAQWNQLLQNHFFL